VERLPRGFEAAYRAFVAEALTEPPVDAVALTGSYLYALLPGLPDLTGLRFLHPGWWLGAFKKDRFEPSHALALGLEARQARRAADFASDRPEVMGYLRGETLASPGENGWTLVTVDGYPLGWGKRVDGRLKSHYPRGLRRVG
jgi:NOL1/NOP2/fmu family ribosome biogenesis protein